MKIRTKLYAGFAVVLLISTGLSLYGLTAMNQLAELTNTLKVRDGEIANLNQEVANLKQDVTNLNQQAANLKQDVTNLNQGVANLKQDVTNLFQAVADGKDTIRKIHLSRSWRFTRPLRFLKRLVTGQLRHR